MERKEGHGTGYGQLTGVLTYTGPGSGIVRMEESFDYDKKGRIISVTRIIDGIEKTITCDEYNSLDSVVAETYPDGETVTYSYNQGGALEGISGNDEYVTGITYTVTGNRGIEFTVLRNDTFVICGLSYANTDPDLDSIDYGIVFTIGATIGIYENGTEVTPPGLKGNIRYNAGVRFGVLRRGNTIVYQRNEETIYESETPGDPSLELFFDCSLYSYEAAIGDIRWVPVDDISFTDIINVAFDSMNNTITRTPQTDAWDAGAASINCFKGNGGIEFTVPQTGAFVICGLSHANVDAGYGSIDYGILCTTGQEFDKGTGLYYYGARYYDPVLGRFIQADTVLDGLNRYTYCGNNPVLESLDSFVVHILIASKKQINRKRKGTADTRKCTQIRNFG